MIPTQSLAIRDVPDRPAGPVETPGRSRFEVDRLGDTIAELAARIQAATYELLVLIREFDERAGWNDGFNGFRSCAHWLNWRTGLALGAAREKVRVARALAELPRLSAAMQRGDLSYSKVRALTRVATPANESELLDFARCATAAHVERLVRAWRRVDRVAEAADGKRRHERRHLETWVDDDGMVVIRGRLSPEVGAVVRCALEAAADRLRQEGREAQAVEDRLETLANGAPTRWVWWRRARAAIWTADRAPCNRSSPSGRISGWRTSHASGSARSKSETAPGRVGPGAARPAGL